MLDREPFDRELDANAWTFGVVLVVVVIVALIIFLP